jgi:hypothetical protein
MSTRAIFTALIAAAIGFSTPGLSRPPVLLAAAAAQVGPDDTAVRALLQRVEQAARQGGATGYLGLLSASADRKRATGFATLEFRPGATRVVIQERDRQRLTGVLPGNGYALTVDAFIESGDRARVSTWQLDVRRADDGWQIADQESVSSVENLYRLTLNSQQQFDARDFRISAEDFDLTLAEGSVFTVDTDQGTTGLVLLGRGDMHFHPAPATEKGQVRIFAGSDVLESRFDAAFVRLGNLSAHADRSTLTPRAVNPRELKKAEQIFHEESVRSFVVDLADLTRDNWSLLPGNDDFLAEVRTRRFATITYARSASEAEDISVFDRRRHRNIAAYASKDKLATRGRFYNEDDLAPFDVIDYDIQVTALPERQWIEGRTRMRLRVRAPSLGQLTIRLADSLVVRSVISNRFGRLFNLRVSNQNTILVNLPATLLQDAEITLTIEYGGRLEAQAPDRESITLQREVGDGAFEETPFLRGEPNFLYSNRSYWYPQSPVTDYATATIEITIPAAYSCVASGEPSSDSPQMIPAKDPSQARKVYLFTADRPLRYLSFLVSRFSRADRWTVDFGDNHRAREAARSAPLPRGPAYNKMDLIVDTNPRQTSRGREVAERAVDIVQFYESILGDSPYSSFTVALIEHTTPGGHSPGYFAALNEPLPNSGLVWRNDPAAFSNYPEFFLAHEVAHQWWGQAVGWRNYHEQWLSEGFAQYFAALYAQHFRGDEVFAGLMRQMRRWALDQSDQGAVYLGYRVGHIRNDSRAFRAIIYNKGAAVLHMLRRLIGDDAFFRGIRRFYTDSRFHKAGSDDLRLAMEAESGRSLERFFEGWIYGSTLPHLAFTYRVEAATTGQQVSLRFVQTGEIFDLPVTVTLQYVDRKPVDVVVPVTDQTVEIKVPLEGVLRAVDISKDDGTLAEIQRN